MYFSLLFLVTAFLFSGSAAAFVGSDACQSCHETEHALWLGSDHDLAMQLPTTDSVLGDFNNTSFTYNGITTRFFRDGDKYVVNGQKIWTSFAADADYCYLICRTTSDGPPHRGISEVIVPMDTPGIEIRRIKDMTTNEHFCEVFFTDVRIPKDHLLGEYNAGWKLATAMLMYERVAIGSAGAGKINQPTYKLLKSAAEESGKLQDRVVRDQLMQIYSMETTKAMVAMRNRAEQKAGKTPGPGGSLGKLFGSNIAWKMREIALEIAGMSSIAWDPADASGAERQRIVLNSFQSSIAGGTDEIQHNILGETVLGLPREPAPDRGLPFRQVNR